MSGFDKWIGGVFEPFFDLFGISDKSVDIIGSQIIKIYPETKSKMIIKSLFTNNGDVGNYLYWDNQAGIGKNIRSIYNKGKKYKYGLPYAVDYKKIIDKLNETLINNSILDYIQTSINNEIEIKYFEIDYKNGFLLPSNKKFQISLGIPNTHTIAMNFINRVGGGYGYNSSIGRYTGSNSYQGNYLYSIPSTDNYKNYFIEITNIKIDGSIIYNAIKYNGGNIHDPSSFSIYLENQVYPEKVNLNEFQNKKVLTILVTGIQSTWAIPSSSLGLFGDTDDNWIGWIPTIYSYGSSASMDSVLDELSKYAMFGFMPFIHLKDSNKLIYKDGSPQLIAQTSKMCRLIGMKLKDFTEQVLDPDTIEDKESANAMEDCVSAEFIFGNDLDDSNQFSSSYLYEFFNKLYKNNSDLEQVRIMDYSSIFFEYLFKQIKKYENVDLPEPTNKKNKYVRLGSDEHIPDVAVGKYTNTEKTKGDAIYVDELTVKLYQYDRKELAWKVVSQEYNFKEQKNLKCILPINYFIYKDIVGGFHKDIFINKTLHLHITNISEKKLNYWETEEFGEAVQNITVAITIIVSIYSAGSLSEVVIAIGESIIVSYGVQEILKVIFNSTDNKFIRAVATIAVIYYANDTSKLNNIGQAIFAVEATNQYMSLQQKYDFVELKHDIDLFNNEYNRSINELETMKDELGMVNQEVNGIMAYLMTLPNSETYDDWYSRSMNLE